MLNGVRAALLSERKQREKFYTKHIIRRWEGKTALEWHPTPVFERDKPLDVTNSMIPGIILAAVQGDKPGSKTAMKITRGS